MKIAILGSCVSRDIFEIVENDWEVGTYIARQNMIALNTAPLKLDFSSGNPAYTGWRRSIVEMSANKDCFAVLRESEYDVLIVDFIDERCANAVDAAGRMISYSPEIQEFCDETNFLEANALRIISDQWPHMGLREEALDFFAFGLKYASKGRPIILHEAYWADTVIGTQPIVYDSNWVMRNNDVLVYCYEGLKRRLKCESVSAKKGEIIGNSDHKWGAAPYHYVPDYYQNVFEQMSSHVKSIL